MKKNRIENAIDVWLDAINNGTLAKGTCAACAVGNLVAEALGGVISNQTLECNIQNASWSAASVFSWFYDPLNYEDAATLSSGKDQIRETRFSIDEIISIERAFERNTYIIFLAYDKHSQSEIKQDQLRGLHACIEVLKTFTDYPEHLDVKEVFTDKVLIPA